MTTMYLLRIEGFGEDDRAYEPTGIFSSRALAEQALAQINKEWQEDMEDPEATVEAVIEEYPLDA